jgi:sarcosine oxidase subunit delta
MAPGIKEVGLSYTITCPICGERDLSEFRFGNEDQGPGPGHEGLTREVYVNEVLMRATQAGPQKEWWCHSDGCGAWITIWRDTLTGRQADEPEALK